MKSRPALILLVLVAIGAGAFSIASCGGSDGGGGDDVASILKATFGSDKQVKSGKLSVAVELNAKGLPALQGPVSLKLTGPFESRGDKQLPAFDLALTLNASGQAFTAGATNTGDKGFLTLQGQAYAVSDALFKQFKSGYGKAQTDAGKKKGGTTFDALGIDPLRWLKNARAAGTAQVGGVKTTHIAAVIDVPKFLVVINTLLSKADKLGVGGAGAAVPTTLTAKQRKQIADAIKTAKVDIYSGQDDRLLRRIEVGLVFEVPAAARKDAGGLASGSLRLDLTIADLNKKQTITAPANTRPLEELTGPLSGLGAGAGSSAAPSTTTPDSAQPDTSTSSSPAANPEYLTCLDNAGTDLAKVQQCARVLAG